MPVIPTVYSRFKTTIVNVGTSATLLPTTPLNSRSTITVQNLSDNPVSIGESIVTITGVTRGYILPTKFSTIMFKLNERVLLYGVAGSNSEVLLLETA